MTAEPTRLQDDPRLKAFFDDLRAAHQRALMLDYDGTLAPFRVDRHKATPYPGVRQILKRMLRAGHTRVVLVTGRAVDDLIPLLGLEPLPEIWGAHGWERRKTDGSYERAALTERQRQALRRAYAWVVQQGFGERCEQKPASLAVHWRGMDESAASDLRARVQQAWKDPAAEAGLELAEFDGGIELRVPGRSKADAVERVLRELGEGTVAAYLGDDLTDEDAFRAIRARGLAILVRREYRPTAAQVWLRPPHGLLEFLRRWHHISGGTQ